MTALAQPAFDPAPAVTGFGFVEYTAPDADALGTLFETLGFTAAARHRRLDVTLYRQGNIDFLVNGERGSFASDFAERHGPSVCGISFMTENADQAYHDALSRGAQPGEGCVSGVFPAVRGIGESLLYLIDEPGWNTFLELEFEGTGAAETEGARLTHIDHLTHNVERGHMDPWAEFYEGVFGFHEIRHFDIRGKLTGLKSRAMADATGTVRIPINESKDDESQIEEFIRDYHGEGVQHIALHTDDIYRSVETLRRNGIHFMTVPDTYFEMIDERLPGHGEDVARLAANRILIDGNPKDGEGLLLQIFTETVIGPVFFEIIQRKGNEGFGEGNFQALFESIELDQIRRGVLDNKGA